MTKFVTRLLCFFVCVLLLPCLCVSAEENLPLISQAAILMEAETGTILYAKNADQRMYPASITKVLTGYLALKYGNEADVLSLSADGFNQVPRTSSHIGWLPEETFCLEEALYALALVSANDAAVAIAENISGSVEEFAQLMNREAQALGAQNSHFVNPNGLPDADHYTTAYDMAMITAEAIRQPDFLLYFGAKEYELPATDYNQARFLESKNQFIDGEMECPGLLMSKTGWTTAAQGTLVTVAKRNNMTLIAVVLSSPMLEDKYTDTQTLLNYGFSSYRRTQLSQSLMEEKLVDLGMDSAFCLEGYTPVNVLLPIGTKAEDLQVSVPGGFDAALGLSTLPVSVELEGEDGILYPIEEILVTISPRADAEPEVQEEEMPEVEQTKQIHPGIQILIILAAVFACMAFVALGKERKSAVK